MGLPGTMPEIAHTREMVLLRGLPLKQPPYPGATRDLLFEGQLPRP
jgi:hypothetical protein